MSTPAIKEDIKELLGHFGQRQASFVDENLASISAGFEAKLKSAVSSKITWKREGNK